MANKNRNPITRVPFHAIQTPALTSGAASLALNPANIVRLATIADTFEEYRIVELMFRLRRIGTLTSVGFAAGFFPGISDTAPNTANLVMESLDACIVDPVTTVPSDWVKVSRENLKGSMDWYKAIAGAATDWEERPGTIYFGGSGTESALIELRGVYEFKGTVDTSDTPVERTRKREERERARILRLLSGTGVPTSALTKPK